MADAQLDRLTVLATELRQFDGWALDVSCAQCRMLRVFQVDELLARARKDATVDHVIRRLRCGKCGARPDWVRLISQRNGIASAPVRKVDLIGSPNPIGRGINSDSN